MASFASTNLSPSLLFECFLSSSMHSPRTITFKPSFQYSWDLTKQSMNWGNESSIKEQVSMNTLSKLFSNFARFEGFVSSLYIKSTSFMSQFYYI